MLGGCLDDGGSVGCSLDGLATFLSCRLGLVGFSGSDDLSITGLEPEPVLPALSS
jgi:hypothetical protein